ncbi:hypothetical protein LJC13_03155, partial [Peptostreptococcaceae bacterium OttesenSCG-928-C18]|nr:hypothetical protein [Peptostreptococcaceae bacterium OttesenSCG-928-C18]
MRNKRKIALFILLVFLINIFSSTLISADGLDISNKNIENKEAYIGNIENDIPEKTEEIEVKGVSEQKIVTMADSVTTAEELVAAVANAVEGEVITLAEGFVFANTALVMPEVNVIIDFENIVWNAGNISISGAGAGSLTIKNLNMDGASIGGRLFKNTASNGLLSIENSSFYNSTGGALDIQTGGNATTEISNTKIYDNTAVIEAPAIRLESSSNVTINKSIIEDNIGTGMAYETGAIGSKNYTATLTINNSIFRNNENKGTASGVIGGGGGAIFMNRFYGKLNINESLFQGNKTNGEDGSIASTYDGGAIYVFYGSHGSEVNINKTTFDSNIAYDDGGAIMIQGNENPGITTNITNCTFFGNKAYGLDGANVTGGAIQFFQDGGSSKMTNNIISSTFVSNQAGNENSKIDQTGGAIALSGSGFGAILVSAKNDNSLFLANTVYSSTGTVNYASESKDISKSNKVDIGVDNVINVDKGVTPLYSNKDILGVENPVLGANGSKITAGTDSENVVVPTVVIKPGSIADNTYTGIADIPTVDQRNLPRYKDNGAVEIASIKYDANGGIFELEDLSAYDGSIYYEKNEEDKVVEYYTVGNTIENTTVVNGKETLKATKEGQVFKGWNTEADGTGDNYDINKELSYTNEGFTLYAQWEEAEIIKEITLVGGT